MRRFASIWIPAGLALAALATLASLPGAALAAGQMGVAGFAGYNTYAMEDINDAIAAGNAELALDGYSERLDEISSGVGFGGGLRFRTPTGVIFGLDYERLTGSSDVTISGSSLEVDAGGGAITGTVNYLFPSSNRARFGIAGGIGYYMSSGTLSVYDPLGSIEFDLEGNGFGFHGGGTLDVALGTTARLEALAGYRFAKATDLEFDGIPTDSEIDWSGFMSRVGLALYFGAQ